MTGSFLFDRLEVIDDPQPRTAAFNMAADECLLVQLGEAPVLRIYRWVQPAISFGYFTRFDEVRMPDGQWEMVRRWTGGGIVEHGADFTYSLVIPRGVFVEGPERSYARIHHALARALAGVGVEADPIGEESASYRRGQDSRCFEHAVPHDVVFAGRKLAGAAQRRTRRGLLHQGSVQGIGAPADWQERLARSLPGVLCASPVRRDLTAVEVGCALRLAETKYATQAWLRRC